MEREAEEGSTWRWIRRRWSGSVGGCWNCRRPPSSAGGSCRWLVGPLRPSILGADFDCEQKEEREKEDENFRMHLQSRLDEGRAKEGKCGESVQGFFQFQKSKRKQGVFSVCPGDIWGAPSRIKKSRKRQDRSQDKS